MFRLINIRTTIASILALGGLLSLSAPAAALESPAPRAVVSYADLAIDQPSGAAALYVRIRLAAREVCEPLGLKPLDYVSAQQCVQQAIGRAVAEVDAPALNSYYLQTVRRPVTLASRD